MIKAVPKPKRGDGSRFKTPRCADCGHPLKEHRQSECTVPRCRCLGSVTQLVEPASE